MGLGEFSDGQSRSCFQRLQLHCEPLFFSSPCYYIPPKNGLILLGLLQMSVEKKVGTGDAKDVICGAVEKLGADILVMGSHDYGFFKRYTQPTTHFSLSTVMMKSLT